MQGERPTEAQDTAPGRPTARQVLGDRPVAVVGAGLVGSGWAIVFARAGLQVRVYDQHAPTAQAVPAFIRAQLGEMQVHGLLDSGEGPEQGHSDDTIAAVLARVQVVPTLAEAVDGVGWVQESVLERVDVKAALLQALAPLLPPDAVVGSSTSGIGASRFTQGLALAPRVLVVHPVNPPHLVPVVELVPSPATAPECLALADALMQAVGQTPVRVNRELEGFVLNRLQGALLREAWALVEDGVASCEDIDKTVRDGLGWRWSFMGPFETIDLNAPGGVADYAQRLGGLYQSIAASRQHEAPWGPALIAEVERQRRQHLAADALADRRAWRDRGLMALAGVRRRRARHGADQG